MMYLRKQKIGILTFFFFSELLWRTCFKKIIKKTSFKKDMNFEIQDLKVTSFI